MKSSQSFLLFLLGCFILNHKVSSFVINTPSSASRLLVTISSKLSSTTTTTTTTTTTLFSTTTTEEKKENEEDDSTTKNMEAAWRWIRKPLLSIGGKGAKTSHGNSLRQLLDAHTCVKVKVNSQNIGTLEEVFETLKELAVETGASKDVELLQIRQSENMIMFGQPGTLNLIQKGEYPPLTKKQQREMEEEEDVDN